MMSRTSKSKKLMTHQPLVSPSLTSLLSGITQTSTGSSGSNSTITQESVTKLRHRVHRKHERKPTIPAKRSSRKDAIIEHSKPDVFAYIEDAVEEEEEEEIGGKSSGRSSLDMAEVPKRTLAHPIPPAAPMSPTSMSSSFMSADMQRGSSARSSSSIASLHSDSGISIRGPSPERAAHKKNSSKTSILRGALTRTMSMSSASSVASRKSVLDEPESYYAQPGRLPVVKAQTKSKELQMRNKKNPASTQPKLGYDMLASSLSTVEEEAPNPIYRRFEALNNRILLVLQDEIVTMEQDLAIYDQQIAEIEGTRSPVSRRLELGNPSPLQYNRIQLCGLLMTRLSQYNRILASYQSVANMTITSEEHIQQYKDLLEQQQPLVKSETAFLDDIADLVTVSATAKISEDQQKVSYEVGAALFFLILAFKLIPSLVGRMFLGGCMVSALAWSGRLPTDEEAVGGIVGKKVGIYAIAVFLLSLAVG